MLLDVMRATNNFFAVSKIEADWQIKNNVLDLSEYKDVFLNGQYLAITNSILNNNIYKLTDYKISDLNDEEFRGAIYGLAPPPDFLQLVQEVEEFEKVETSQQNRRIVSERFENYSWTAATDANGQLASWQVVYKDRLRKFRRMFSEVKL